MFVREESFKTIPYGIKILFPETNMFTGERASGPHCMAQLPIKSIKTTLKQEC